MEENTQGIKAWAEDERPREKLMLKGKKSLSNSELLAILLRAGTSKKTAVDVARELLSFVNNDLNKLARLTISDLRKFEGIGPVKAVTIIAAIELGSRKSMTNNNEVLVISSSQDIYNEIKNLMEDLNYEQFFITTLSQSNEVIRTHMISDGGISATMLDARRLFKCALDDFATGIILSHNHPSGNLKPSAQDIALTKRVSKAADLLDIKVLDHVIVSNRGYYSFADEGIL